MGLSYYGSRISPNMTKTPEGYLICMNVPIARTGKQEYLARELQLKDRKPDDIIVVERTEEEVFNPATIASFEGKPFTDDHPNEDVTSTNYDYYSKGHTQNVHRGTGDNAYNLVADIYITNPSVIREIENGKRQISCGYTCDYLDNGDGTYSQSRIRGNHIALVDEGRAGASVSIKDSKIKERRIHEMGNTIGEKVKGVLNLLARSAKDAKSVDDTENMVCDAKESISAIINQPKVEEKVETKDAALDGNTALKNALLTASLALNEAIAYLGNNNQEPNNIEQANQERPLTKTSSGIVPQTQQTPDAPAPETAEAPSTEESKDVPFNEETSNESTKEPVTKENDNSLREAEDELKALDELSEELKEKKEEAEEAIDPEETDSEETDENESETVEESEDVYTTDEDDAEVIESEDVVEGYTKDAMAKFVRDMKPIIAQISNDKERAKVCDAFVKTFRKATSDGNSLAKIMNANDSYVKSMTNDSQPFTYEAQQSVFDKLNPHLK